jgi:trimethylamine---corrinoid protein Co-methyltransferase
MNAHDDAPPAARPRTRKEARQRVRTMYPTPVAFIKRAIPPYEMLDEEQLVQIETHADRILQEIGMEIRGDEVAVRLWKNAGADIDGEWRVRVPMGLARQIVKRSAPAEFT